MTRDSRTAPLSSTTVRLALLVVAVLVAATVVGRAAPAHATDSSPCGAGVNPVACENRQAGTPESVWDVDGAGDASIQGFSTDVSVASGSTIGFKIKTTARAYTIDIYRLGYYGGNGARKVASVTPSATLPQTQPACATDAATSLYDCGTWAVSASWAVPSTAVSGVYLAKLTRTDTGGASHISFVVRNDASTADIVYQTSDETWQAYNRYGGSDFYTGNQQVLFDSPTRARRLSYNRPYATRDDNDGRDFLFSNEYPTIRFLERNGYDVDYVTGVDVDRYGAAQLRHHKVFMSVGHDEYWSQNQRTNVENARDAGVNEMFLSGNEVYWHTRFENSIDGSNTAYRTLTCYKVTWDNANTDPSGEATGTFRDPRYSNAPGGANPENSLTGTAYMANTDDLPITVTAPQGKLRVWRGTSLSSATGSTALAPHTIGYESDEDLDNGFRPAGLIDLSTTVGPTDQYLQDFGTNTTPGTTTHHITLYRAASGALVFGAGTIQWGWGLDADHDGTQTAADSRMQQATVNLLADMRTQPSTLMTGLVPASASTDTTAPTSTVTSPAAGATLANGATVTVTGTATDTGGGVVAGVEVSLDGGTTWHPATGTTSWSYTGVLHGDGVTAVRSRATDDSANTEAPSAGRAVTVACPCTLFGTQTPKTADSGDGGAYELGTSFSATTDGVVTGVRFYKSTANTGTHTGSLWSAAGTLLATGTFSNETASGWQTLTFSAPVGITAGTSYVASYYDPSGHYASDIDFFYYRPYTATPLTAVADTPANPRVNGLFSTSAGFPTDSGNPDGSVTGTNYYVDPVFQDSTTVAPTVTAHTPGSGAASVAVGTAPTATFSKSVVASTVAFTLADGSGNPVTGTVSYADASRTATFTPAAPLAAGTLYTATVTATDANGNKVPAPVTWTFRTAYADQVGGACPCTLFPDSATPATAAVNDHSSVELGVRFSSDTNGVVTGVRFYKSTQNTGTHTGSLWSSTGTQLATAVFTGESASGWQTVEFSNPVSITAGTTYVASYHTSTGYYSATSGAYGSTGLDNFPLHVPVNGGAYTYPSGFPSSSSSADYGIDVEFTVPAATQPSVVSNTPASGATNVGSGTAIRAALSDSVLGGTANVAVTASTGGSVTGTTTLDATHRQLTFTPGAALTDGTTYTVTINGLRTLSGTLQAAPYSWTFTVSGTSACPCTLFDSGAVPAVVDSGDGSAVVVGTGFTPSTDGYVSGVQFYKAAANTGTHVGSLWSASGTLLATGTFTGESATGWQSLTFGQGVAVTAGTTYVVGYYAPNGHYSSTSGFYNQAYTNGPLSVAAGSNGTYAYGGATSFPSSSYNATNYWVTPVLQTGSAPDTTPPVVTSVTPPDGTASVPTTVAPTAVLSKPVTPASLTFTLTPSGGAAVAGAVTYDAGSGTATFTPAAALAPGTVFTARVTATDTSGNAMSAPATWSFTTQAAPPASGVCPCSIWDDTATPATTTSTDHGSVELGLAFTSDTAGQVTGLRFYKGPQNTGTHTGTLWDTSGNALATVTVTGESTSGWQTASFPTPVAMAADTTYVISYHAPVGSYSSTSYAFASSGVDAPPLHVTAHASRYAYGPGTTNPANTSDANYWVDPVVTTGTPPADTTPPTVSAVGATANDATSATVTWTTDEAATSRVDYGTSATALTNTATTAGSATSHTVALTGLSPSTTYWYRVTSADAAGNSTTLPTTSSTPNAVTTPAPPDTTPPVVSAVGATANDATSATVTWTTDEAATSRVDYGTSATALTSTATSSGLGTGHTVALTGLSPSTTYWYRVTSADAAGNSTTLPTTSSTPNTVTTPAPPDTTPPVVSAVAAASTGSTTATVTWTTDEAATSRVDYGTSATALTSTATSSGLGTSHTVALTGLAPSTRYWYRVTSADAAGNSTTSPATGTAAASFAPTLAPATDTTTADFTAGTRTSTYAADNGDGEVVLTPTGLTTEFSGTSLPSGTASTTTVFGGRTTVGGGTVSLSGTSVSTTSGLGTGRTLQTRATLSTNQRIGWTSTSSSAVTASFSVNSSRQLVASVNDGGSNVASAVVASGWTAAPHTFRVDWTSSAVTFFLDDVQGYTHAFATLYGTSYRVTYADTSTSDAALVVDWLRIGPYATAGTFTSRVQDAGAPVSWDALTWDATVPTGTTLQVAVRTGATATPDSSWSAWTAVGASGAQVAATARYLQYQLTVTTTGSAFATPTIRSVQVGRHV